MKTAAKIGIEIGAAFSGKFKSVFGEANSSLVKIGGEIRKLEASQKMLGNSIETFGKMGKNVDGLRAKYATVTAEIEKARRAQDRLMSAKSGMASGKEKMAGAGMAIGAVTAAAATAGLPIVQAAQFEKAMLGVAKQVEGARDSSGKLTSVYYDMAKQVQLLGREIPLATNDLADMVAAGARMGVAKDELIAFTRTAAMMSSAFELPAGELAEQMGKIANLYKIPIPAIGDLADTINYLDDNAISKGGDIIEYLTRTGGIAGAVKITSNEMAALGSTLLTLGERTETAGTATNAMFQKLAAGEKGTKGFKSAMEELGLSVTDVQNGMQVDAQGTLIKVLEAVNKVDPSKRLGVLTEMFGLEHADTVAKLATNMGEYRKQIEMVQSGAAKGSMGKEFAAQLQTTSAQWEIMKNRVTEVSVNLGSVLLPAVNSVLGGFGRLTSGVADFVSNNKTLVGNVATAVGVIGGIFAATKLAAFGVGLVTFAINALKLAIMTNPIGLFLTGLTVAGVLLWKNWDAIKTGLAAIWTAIADSAVAAFTWVKDKLGEIMDWITAKVEWVFGKINTLKDMMGSVLSGDFGKAWDGYKSFYGFGDNATAGTTAPAAAVPAAAAGGNVTQSSTVNAPITINGATDPAETARLVKAELDKRDRQAAANRRGQMTDTAGY
jgi:TP901 family phage tail tape measure protein